MKKSQRARYLALESQATRTAAEESEFQTLKTLALAHPDAAKDTDDSKPAKGITLGDLTAKITAALSAKENLVRENGTLTQRVKDLEAGNVGSVTLGAVLVALDLKPADLAGKDAAAIAIAIKAPATTAATDQAAQIQTLTTARDAATAAFSALLGTLGFQSADLVITPENCAKLGVKQDEAFAKLTPAEQSAKVIRAAFDHSVSTRAAAALNELGIAPDRLPGKTGADAVDTLADLQAAMAGEKDSKKLGILAAKANKLRDQVTPGNN